MRFGRPVGGGRGVGLVVLALASVDPGRSEQVLLVRLKVRGNATRSEISEDKISTWRHSGGRGPDPIVVGNFARVLIAPRATDSIDKYQSS